MAPTSNNTPTIARLKARLTALDTDGATALRNLRDDTSILGTVLDPDAPDIVVGIVDATRVLARAVGRVAAVRAALDHLYAGGDTASLPGYLQSHAPTGSDPGHVEARQGWAAESLLIHGQAGTSPSPTATVIRPQGVTVKIPVQYIEGAPR